VVLVAPLFPLLQAANVTTSTTNRPATRSLAIRFILSPTGLSFSRTEKSPKTIPISRQKSRFSAQSYRRYRKTNRDRKRTDPYAHPVNWEPAD
jgi:hypothetical protein